MIFFGFDYLTATEDNASWSVSGQYNTVVIETNVSFSS